MEAHGEAFQFLMADITAIRLSNVNGHLISMAQQTSVTAMTTAFFDSSHDHASAKASTRPAISPALRDILARKDDRLLRDVGLTREDIIGPEETFRAEWRRMRDTWNL
jgi:hypothetical protein